MLRKTALFVFASALLFSARPGYTQIGLQVERYPHVRPKPRERCLICGALLTEKDATLLVRGRRVPLKSGMVDSFMHNQVYYFSRLQPKGALFQENLEAPPGVAQGGITRTWFLLGLYILLALTFAGLSCSHAVMKGLPPSRYFVIGLIFSVFGYLYALTRPAATKLPVVPSGLTKPPGTRQPIPCEECGETNHPAAKRCAGCGKPLQPQVTSESEQML